MNAITQKHMVKSSLFIFLLLFFMSCHENSSSDFLKEEVTLENVDLRNDYDGVDDKSLKEDITEGTFKAKNQGWMADE